MCLCVGGPRATIQGAWKLLMHFFFSSSFICFFFLGFPCFKAILSLFCWSVQIVSFARHPKYGCSTSEKELHHRLHWLRICHQDIVSLLSVPRRTVQRAVQLSRIPEQHHTVIVQVVLLCCYRKKRRYNSQSQALSEEILRRMVSDLEISYGSVRRTIHEKLHLRSCRSAKPYGPLTNSQRCADAASQALF